MWFFGRRKRLRELNDQQQVYRLQRAVVHTVLSAVGEEVLWDVLEDMDKNRREKGHSDYTSLADVWIAGAKKCH